MAAQMSLHTFLRDSRQGVLRFCKHRREVVCGGFYWAWASRSPTGRANVGESFQIFSRFALIARAGRPRSQ